MPVILTIFELFMVDSSLGLIFDDIFIIFSPGSSALIFILVLAPFTT